MISKAKLISIGVFCYVLFLLLLTPAAWWLKFVSLPAGLQLGPVTGTLWQGQVAAAEYQKIQLSKLDWRFQPAALISGKLEFEILSGNASNTMLPYVNGILSYGFSGLGLSNSIIRIPVVHVLPMLNLPLPVDAQGELVLDIAEYQAAKPWCKTLKGGASWQNARLQAPTGTWLDLQSLFGQVGCADGNLLISTDGKNVLGLNIEATLDGQGLSVAGSLRPDVSLPDEVHQAMKFVGKPDQNGRYNIRF